MNSGESTEQLVRFSERSKTAAEFTTNLSSTFQRKSLIMTNSATLLLLTIVVVGHLTKLRIADMKALVRVCVSEQR